MARLAGIKLGQALTAYQQENYNKAKSLAKKAKDLYSSGPPTSNLKAAKTLLANIEAIQRGEEKSTLSTIKVISPPKGVPGATIYKVVKSSPSPVSDGITRDREFNIISIFKNYWPYLVAGGGGIFLLYKLSK